MQSYIHLVAFDKNGVIGLDNKLPFSIPEDLKRFSNLTKNHIICMGYKTYLDILENHSKDTFLEDRKVIVVLQNPTNLKLDSDGKPLPDTEQDKTTKYKSRLDLQKECKFDNVKFMYYPNLDQVRTINAQPIIVVGGKHLYSYTTPLVVLATHVDIELDTTDKEVIKYPFYDRLSKSLSLEDSTLTSKTNVKFKYVTHIF